MLTRSLKLFATSFSVCSSVSSAAAGSGDNAGAADGVSIFLLFGDDMMIVCGIVKMMFVEVES